MNVLVVDIGGTHVKLLVTGQDTHRQFDSGPTLTPETMVSQVRKLVSDSKYDVVSIGYPGPVLHGRIVSEPHNLGTGWVGFNFEAAFRRAVKIVNDAAMQARGSYKGPRQDVIPRFGNRPWVHDDCGWHRGTHGVGTSSVQESDVRR